MTALEPAVVRISDDPASFFRKVCAAAGQPDLTLTVDRDFSNPGHSLVITPFLHGRELFRCRYSLVDMPVAESGAVAEQLGGIIAQEIRSLAPSNEQILIGADPTAKLDTGMTVQEAAARAEAWWEKTGRKMMLKKSTGKNPFASLDKNDPNFMPSGLLAGRPWDALEKREKLMVIKAWHHFFVRRPDKLDIDPEKRFRLTKSGEKPQ